jgi:hypothetical protein
MFHDGVAAGHSGDIIADCAGSALFGGALELWGNKRLSAMKMPNRVCPPIKLTSV